MPPFHSPAGRGPDELVVYTTNTGERTGTNEHGVEAVVARGTVRRVGGNNSVIPPDGFVVSGHGQAGTWLRTSARVGAAVSLDRRTMTVTFTVDAGTAGKRRDSR